MSTTDQTTRALGDATLTELDESLRGDLVRPGDPDYEQARRSWNHAIDRRPALVVRPSGVADVVRAVAFARSEGVPVAVRGGGHSIAGFSTCDGGLVIDLCAMRAVHVDPVARRALVQGGATWADVDHECQVHGLATPGGYVSTTGVGGLTLGGGLGHLLRRHGLSCDNLVSAQVVTAAGEVVHAGEGGDTELLWALRGGGGNFGVVTTMEFALHPVGPIVLGGPVFFRGDRVAEVAARWREAIVGTPDELTTALALSTAPPVPFLPAESHGTKIVGVVACWSGSAEEGEDAIAPMRTLGEPIADLIGPIPYVALQQLLDPLWTAGAANYFGSTMLTELTDAALGELVDRHRAAPGLPTTCELHVHDISGAASRIAEDATAYSQRRPGYVVNCLARSPGLDGFADCAAWAREARDAVAAHGTGRTYVNYTGDVDADKVRASYPPATYDRLAVLKRRLDPANMFRFNQNIRPA